MLDSNTIEQLFGRLHVRYGAKLAAAYQGVEMAYVKADWAQMLDGVQPHCIDYAIANLPIDWPPNAGQFLALCQAAPTKVFPALKRPDPTPDDRAKASQILADLKRKLALRKVASPEQGA